MVYLRMEESQDGQFKKHEFRINFHFQNKLYTATASMFQRAEHDEYHVLPDDSTLSKEYGSRIVDLYYDQPNPFRCRHPDSEYMKAIVKGVEEYLNSKHA